MTKISVYVNCEDITVRPDRPNRITIDADGVELEELLDYIDEKGEIFTHLVGSNPEEFVSDSDLSEFLDKFPPKQIADYLESRGWSMKEDGD